RPLQTFFSGIAIVIFAGFLLSALRRSGDVAPQPLAGRAESLGDPAALSRELFAGFLLHFEAVSVLLLAALVGAFVLARRERLP
ncbi:MAG: NADH-quinone oxidoreductase subunit J, partial [Acidobacteriota bacterium]